MLVYGAVVVSKLSQLYCLYLAIVHSQFNFVGVCVCVCVCVVCFLLSVSMQIVVIGPSAILAEK